MINTLTLLLVALSLPCSTGQRMESIPSSAVVKKPGETLSLSCRGSGFTFSCCAMSWIRQPAGKALEWIGVGYSNASRNTYASSVQGRVEISRDDSNSMVHLQLSNLKPEDSAVYYCAKDMRGGAKAAFDYWGRGTEVTVSAETASPTLFPLVKCEPDNAETITVGCLARDFYPKSLTFQWTDAKGTTLTSVQYPATEKNNKYTGVSLLQVSKSDWNSRRSLNCSVTHPGGSKSVKLEKRLEASCPTTSVAPITVTLNQPIPKELFINNQAKLECIITAQPQINLDDIRITWQINGHSVTDNITETNSKANSKISTLTRSRSEWQSDSSVRCSAGSDKVTPVTQDLTIHKGDGRKPKVTVHVLTDEDISKISRADSPEVTLVCLVSSPSSVQQDYYITWLEEVGENQKVYSDGVNFPPQKTERGFSVTSIYTTTKDKWNKPYMFSCNVWPAGSKMAMEPRGVSNGHNGSTEYDIRDLHLAMNCTDGATEEDEYSSLWSTTTSFIFLFISSLLYSMIFSLVKMKRP